MYSPALALAVLTASLYATSCAADPDGSSGGSLSPLGLTITTAQGKVTGTQVLPRVRQWLGIPFATGARWTAPTPPPVRTTTLNANAYGKSCPQLSSTTTDYYMEFAHQQDQLDESEDCLTLNIWAPATTRPQNTAVLIWIYGGGFQFGASALKVQDGRYFVRDSDDLILVTINYRLNIFGQPNAPQLVSPTSSQNFGLLDQKAAIDWVKDNIAAFGGDPNRISIFGQSAGGTSADVYAQAYPTDTTVKGIILQSGSISSLGDLGSPTLDSAPWETVAAAVGCGSAPTPAQLTCMKGIPSATLTQTARDAGVIFFKLVTDNIIIHSDWATRFTTGNYLKVPTVIGTVQHEADPLTVGGELAARGNAPATITTLRADILSQLGGTCGASTAASERVNNGVTTWRYQYQAVFPGISTRQDLRAFHGSDIPIVFGTFASIHTPSAAEVGLSVYVKNAWSAFAKNPSTGLTGLGWPTYNPSTNTLVQLGGVENPTGLKLGSPALLDATCSHATELFGILTQLGDILNAIP
ncbi:carboxylesterase [Ephemerocybe angulata]|uniref:Carboxylic ester hydrolase n=1 Tax=Ephemerocybe angulata TaxID=980116 RepID=A0A8H6IC80_9AGAR|nr:carboxylesterase [Tulosesus angulatus]